MNIPAAGTIPRRDYVYKPLTWTHWIILLIAKLGLMYLLPNMFYGLHFCEPL
jgi:hypothetical protein